MIPFILFIIVVYTVVSVLAMFLARDSYYLLYSVPSDTATHSIKYLDTVYNRRFKGYNDLAHSLRKAGIFGGYVLFRGCRWTYDSVLDLLKEKNDRA